MKTKRVAIIGKYSAFGGVSKMMTHLAKGLSEFNINVDLVISGGEAPYVETNHQKFQIINLNCNHVYSSFFSFIRYLNTYLPDVILATNHKTINLAILAHYLAKGKENRRLIIRLSGNISSSIAQKRFLRKWLHNFPIRHLYKKAHKIVAVSEGVAKDFFYIVDFPQDKLHIVSNPTIPEDIHFLSKQPIDHPWFVEKTEPIILGVGRFTKRKDFTTLIEAFSALRRRYACRLVLVGDGQEKEAYHSLALKLGIADHVSLTGFTSNPYAYMAKADALALTSKAAEGSPNVLKEALALGLPVVSTDCPSGPREILQDGKFGRLVPVQDPQSLAAALEDTLRHPPDPDLLKSAVDAYTIQSSTQQYMRVFELDGSV